jgi:hypothetical protein
MMIFSVTKFMSILGVMTVHWHKSMKDRLTRKKHIGVCRWELSPIRKITPKFPHTMSTKIPKKKKKKGSWTSGLCVNLARINSVTVE